MTTDPFADYGFVANAFEIRLMCCIGTLPSHIGFDLSAIAMLAVGLRAARRSSRRSRSAGAARR